MKESTVMLMMFCIVIQFDLYDKYSALSLFVVPTNTLMQSL